MPTKSIRFRLTLWYTVSLVLALIFIFGSFYFITRQVLHTQTDSLLTAHSNEIVEIVANQRTDMHQAMAKEIFSEEFSNNPGMFAVIMNSGGMIVASSQAVNPTDPVIRDLFERAKQSGQPVFADRRLGDQQLRFLSSPIEINRELLAVVVMGHPVDVISRALNLLVIMLGVFFVFFFLAAVLGGYLNARAAVAPISAISRQLKKINYGNLNERVMSPNTGDEIEELSVTFNSLLDRLHSAFRRERQFIGDVAHEVKTPLAAQRANIEVVLAKARSNSEYRQALEDTLVDNQRLGSTLKDVLDLAWSEADAARAGFSTVDLSAIAADIKELAAKMAVKKQIKVEGGIQTGLMISGRKDKLERALINLVDNAVKYTPEKGKITVSLEKRSGQAVFTVKDNGRGIAPGDLPHIFERFYRGSKTDKTFGAGLGLAISQAIVRVHRGEIRVKSTVGRGSEFKVLLPRFRS